MRGRRWPFCWLFCWPFVRRWVPVLSIVFRGEPPRTHRWDLFSPMKSYQIVQTGNDGTIRPTDPRCFSRWNWSTVRKPHGTEYREHAPLPKEEVSLCLILSFVASLTRSLDRCPESSFVFPRKLDAAEPFFLTKDNSAEKDTQIATN